MILARQNAKPVSFGFPGGLGIEKFIEFARTSYGAIFTEETAQKYKQIWLDAYPEMKHYFAWIFGLCEDGGGLCNIQQYMSGRVRGHVPYTVACNTLFQGLTADGAKAALCEAIRRCYTPVYIDENYNEVPEGEGRLSFCTARASSTSSTTSSWARRTRHNGHDFSLEFSAVMESKYQPWTADVKIHTESVMMRRWRKCAKAVTHNGMKVSEGGILVPFEDRALYAKKAA